MRRLRASHLSIRPRFIRMNSLEMPAVKHLIALAGGVPPEDDLQLLQSNPACRSAHKSKAFDLTSWRSPTCRSAPHVVVSVILLWQTVLKHVTKCGGASRRCLILGAHQNGANVVMHTHTHTHTHTHIVAGGETAVWMYTS
jgi:hypothetical protein